MTDRQCPSCGGFCKKECERADVKQSEQEPVSVVKIEHDRQVELAQAYERGWNAALGRGHPVAWLRKNGFRFIGDIEPEDDSEIPLYTAPPKREWVGLTDEEQQEIVKQEVHWTGIAIAIEVKLKEKNGF